LNIILFEGLGRRCQPEGELRTITPAKEVRGSYDHKFNYGLSHML
jgi:hypothetical protein